jgi:hypothetical protein
MSSEHSYLNKKNLMRCTFDTVFGESYVAYKFQLKVRSIMILVTFLDYISFLLLSVIF